MAPFWGGGGRLRAAWCRTRKSRPSNRGNFRNGGSVIGNLAASVYGPCRIGLSGASSHKSINPMADGWPSQRVEMPGMGFQNGPLVCMRAGTTESGAPVSSHPHSSTVRFELARSNDIRTRNRATKSDWLPNATWWASHSSGIELDGRESCVIFRHESSCPDRTRNRRPASWGRSLQPSAMTGTAPARQPAPGVFRSRLPPLRSSSCE